MSDDKKISEMKIIREINIQAEAFYEEAVQLGDHAAYVLGKDRRSQMTNLETIAESALKTTDIFDYIKKQTGRFEEWRKGDGSVQQGLGERLLAELGKLARRRDSICGSTRLDIGNKTDEQKQERQRIYLLLIRQFIRQMVAEYEFWSNVGIVGSVEGANNGTHD